MLEDDVENNVPPKPKDRLDLRYSEWAYFWGSRFVEENPNLLAEDPNKYGKLKREYIESKW